MTFTAESTGTYYIATDAWGSSASSFRTGTYKVSVTDVSDDSLDDHGASAATAGTVSVGGSATGEIGHAGDTDWFAVTLEAGKTYRIYLNGGPSHAGTLRIPHLRGIHDADGNRIANTWDDDSGPGRDSQITFTAGSTGTYYIAASDWSTWTGTYRLSVTDISDDSGDDHGASATTAGAVSVGGAATGEIGHPGDIDWFAVTLEAGKTYRIDLKGESSHTGTLRDPYLRSVHDADGNRIAGVWDDDSGYGTDSQLTFTVETAGTYYLAAGAWGRWTGTYRVSVTEVAAGSRDDYGASPGTAGTVTVGGSATGAIGHTGDTDWFAVTLEAGKTYRIDLNGVSGGGGTLRNPNLRAVRDADGNPVAGMSDDDGGPGRNSQLIFTADTAGRYYLEAGASGSGTGTYGVSVTDVTDSVLSKGGPAGETIRGSDGADTLYGRSGDDTLEGGAGDDMLRGNAGADTLRGGDGKDTLRGGKGDDTLEGGAGDDSLDGGEGNDALHGDGGDDMLRGRKGDDKLYGGAGADDLRGGVGNDILDGGAGDDRLFGGAGNDKFVFAGSFGTDRIRDFGNGEDLIDLSGLSVTFEDAMSGARQDGRDVRIELEGSGTIVLEGVRLSELDSSDFLF